MRICSMFSSVLLVAIAPTCLLCFKVLGSCLFSCNHRHNWSHSRTVAQWLEQPALTIHRRAPRGRGVSTPQYLPRLPWLNCTPAPMCLHFFFHRAGKRVCQYLRNQASHSTLSLLLHPIIQRLKNSSKRLSVTHIHKPTSTLLTPSWLLHPPLATTPPRCRQPRSSNT